MPWVSAIIANATASSQNTGRRMAAFKPSPSRAVSGPAAAGVSGSGTGRVPWPNSGTAISRIAAAKPPVATRQP